MKIAIVSKADSFGGGASRVAEELTELANKQGYVVHHYASWAGKGFDGNIRRGLYGRFSFVVRRLHFLFKKLGFPELIPFELPFMSRRLKEQDYDLIHFHDLSSAISPLTLLWLSKKIPVVWTIHDCSPFTGGCLYPMGCKKYQTDCFRCPQAGTWPIDSIVDLVFLGRYVKKLLHKQKNLYLLTPSQWMSDTAYSSNMLSKAPQVISNGVDINAFLPIDKAVAKARLGLPTDRVVILLSAGHILDERKGTKYALEAIRRIKDLDPFLLLVGAVDDEARTFFEGVDHHEAGYLSGNEVLNLHYAAADLFLFCSLADNQPLSVLETMASGTPIVGFKTGGIPEMVLEGETGTLVSPRDEDRLEKALRQTIEEKSYIQWGKNARSRAEKVYSESRFLEAHMQYYEDVVTDFLKRTQDEF